MHPRLIVAALFVAAFASAQPAAPDSAPAKPDNPPSAPAEAKTEMQKWIETTDAQWQAAFKRDVTDAHDAELNKVRLQYLTALEDGIKKASAANDLKGAVALRDEQKRFGDTQLFPEKDEDGDAPAVKAVRAAIRGQLTQVEKDKAVRAKVLHSKYDQLLAQAQTQLTQRQRLDDALLVQAKRDEIAAAWITPSIASPIGTPAQAPTAPVTPRPATSVPKDPFGTKSGSMTASRNNPVGTWRFQIKDRSYIRTFHEDGTITGDGFEGAGKWRVTASKIIITYPNRGDGWVDLPLNPKGTKAQSHNGEPQTVTKISP